LAFKLMNTGHGLYIEARYFSRGFPARYTNMLHGTTSQMA
jgi:hypothetical protein